MRHVLFIAVLFLSACAGTGKPGKAPSDEAPLVLKAVEFSALPGWGGDNLSEFLPALQNTCARLAKKDWSVSIGTLEQAGTAGDWQRICGGLAEQQDNASLKSYIEKNLMPYEASAAGKAEGLFTGYYEAGLNGSRTKQGPYTIPLYARPDDLVMVDLGEFREELKGQRIAGRVQGGNLKPYEDRAAIVAGQWPHNDKALVWVDDAVDAFFVQIQGSGVVQLDDGGVLRIGYAGQNGHVYYAIGRELIKRGELTKDNVSMQAIESWLAAHPEQADEIMNTNRSYVFFQEIQGGGGPLGGENVALTPGRSLAIDRSKIPYGIPVWVAIDEPAPGAGNLRRLMMAQDTGGAIRGAVRGDVFWGYGEKAEAMAGPMKSQGRYWLLLPRA